MDEWHSAKHREEFGETGIPSSGQLLEGKGRRRVEQGERFAMCDLERRLARGGGGEKVEGNVETERVAVGKSESFGW